MQAERATALKCAKPVPTWLLEGGGGSVFQGLCSSLRWGLGGLIPNYPCGSCRRFGWHQPGARYHSWLSSHCGVWLGNESWLCRKGQHMENINV